MGFYKNTPERFWVMHNFIKMNPLYVVIQDVRKFMLATREIVVLDFHRFPKDFNEEIHKVIGRHKAVKRKPLKGLNQCRRMPGNLEYFL